MISNVLLFLSLVLLVIPIWMKYKLTSNQDMEKSKSLKSIFSIIKAFQIWGLYWLICSSALRLINDSKLEGIFGTIVYTFIFLLPIIGIVLMGVKNKNGID